MDGEEVQPGLFDDTFISLSLEAGEHTVEMHYYPAGLTLGIVITLICLAAFVLILILEKRISRNGYGNSKKLTTAEGSND